MNENLDNGSSELPNEVKLNSDVDSNPIFDIISTLQNKLGNTTSQNISNESAQKTSDNITKDENSFDMSKIKEIMNNINQNSVDNNVGSSNTSADILSGLTGLNLDANTIMRFQKIFSKLNQDDPRKTFLTSLKPFLRETRQKNLDTYITLIALADAFDIFGKKTGGE